MRFIPLSIAITYKSCVLKLVKVPWCKTHRAAQCVHSKRIWEPSLWAVSSYNTGVLVIDYNFWATSLEGTTFLTRKMFLLSNFAKRFGTLNRRDKRRRDPNPHIFLLLKLFQVFFLVLDRLFQQQMSFPLN